MGYKVVTSAAFIMLGVFASFLFGGDSVVKMFGVGLTTAIVVDDGLPVGVVTRQYLLGYLTH